MIQLNINDAIAYVTLCQPEKQNALSFDMFKQLDSIGKQLAKDKMIRAVIIQGSGSHFSSGLDVKAVTSSPGKIISLLWKWLPGNRNLVQRVVLRWQSLPVPVFAVINGNCFGGGLQIALGCDFRIASPSAKFAIMEARWGLCPDMGATLHLPAQLNYDDALWLSMSADPIDASTAQAMGLVTEINDNPLERCLDMIAGLQSRSPDALAAIKRLCLSAYHNKSRTILAQETSSQLSLLLNKNTKIAMKNARAENKLPFAPRK